MSSDKKRFDLIVFDWDGTLMDSAAAIVVALQQACTDIGLPPPEPRQARSVIGLGLREAISQAVPSVTEAQLPQLVERYRIHYLGSDQTLTLFPGVAEMLAALNTAGWQLAVATGKSRIGLNRALAQTGIARCFETTRCADETLSKPNPQMLLEIMDALAVSPERTLMVGDTTHDLQMARNAAVAALAVSFGAHPRDVLQQETSLAVLDDPQQYLPWFMQHA